MADELEAGTLDERDRSRKFRLAREVLRYASAVAVILAGVAVVRLDATAWPPFVVNVLYWWAAVAGGVLTLYGGANVLTAALRRSE